MITRLRPLIFASLASLLSLQVVAARQQPMAMEEHAATLTTERVAIGSEYLPRFAHILPNSLIVPAGKTVTLPPDATLDAIEVSGTLRCDRRHDFRLAVIHVLILPGGAFDCGTVEDPMLGKVEIVFRDVPIDHRLDPFQWGNGLVNFGTQTRVGRAMARGFAVLAEDAPASATTLTVDQVPSGWTVGDELLLPDMNPPESGPRREEGVTIAGISGNVLTLSKPLGFGRNSVTKPDGEVIVRPRVANLTRTFVVRSENPAGTRGHTVNMGPDASWDIRYNQFVGMGRTRADADLHNTVVDDTGTALTVGANQIAKYASHDHHTGTSLAVRNTIGNSFNGTYGSKWAHVVHAAHDVVVEDNVCTDFQGGCFTTEDGYETRNSFRRNVAAYSRKYNRFDAGAQFQSGRHNPGGEGSGFWFRGLHNTIEGNEAWNNVTGLNLFNQNQVAITSMIPSVKGGSADAKFDRRKMAPLSVKGNVTIGNSFVGLEFWATPRFYVEDHISVNNRLRQAWAANSTGVSFLFKNLQAWGGHEGVAGSQGYVDDLEILGGYIGGSRIALPHGMAARLVHLKDVVLQSSLANIQSHGGARQRFENVMHLRLADSPTQFIVGIGVPVKPWEAGEPFPRNGNYSWFRQEGPRTVIINWQGTGQDYTLYGSAQLRSQDAWPAYPYTTDHAVFVPEHGLTMGQAWDKYGLAFLGGVIDDGVGVALDGIPGTLARPGRDLGLGLPRTVMTMPSYIAPLPAGTRTASLYFMLTGDPAQANNVGVISIDGGSPIRMTQFLSTIAPAQRRYNVKDLADGIHTVKAWREDPQGNKIAASEMTFRFGVGVPAGDEPSPAGAAACEPTQCDKPETP